MTDISLEPESQSLHLQMMQFNQSELEDETGNRYWVREKGNWWHNHVLFRSCIWLAEPGEYKNKGSIKQFSTVISKALYKGSETDVRVQTQQHSLFFRFSWCSFCSLDLQSVYNVVYVYQ